MNSSKWNNQFDRRATKVKEEKNGQKRDEGARAKIEVEQKENNRRSIATKVSGEKEQEECNGQWLARE